MQPATSKGKCTRAFLVHVGDIAFYLALIIATCVVGFAASQHDSSNNDVNMTR
jgi:hypothetical protein